MTRALLLVVLLAAAVGCQRDEEASTLTVPPSPAAAAKQQLTQATLSDPKTFNPILVVDSASAMALEDVFEALVRLNPKTTEIEPMLAESWEYSADGSACTFHLRHDVRWQDGNPFTASDVAFTFKAVFDDRVPNSAKHVLTVDGKPIKVETLDESTVRFTAPHPFAPLLDSIRAVDILPEHILGAALEKGTLAQQWGIDSPPGKLIGTGPFRMVQYAQGQFLRYRRNPDYWMRDEAGKLLPYLEEKILLIVPNQDALYLKFVGGQTDVHYPRPEEVAELQTKSAELGLTVSEIGTDTGTQFVTFNRNPRHYEHNGKRDPRLNWFTDKTFLKALAHAVDKKSMILNCLNGYGIPAVAYISPENRTYHNPNLTDYDYDLDEARRLLAEGGYVNRGGDLYDKDGNRVEFNLTTNAGNQIREKMCSILKEDWTKLGMEVNYRPLDFPSLVEKLDTNFDWDAILIGFTGGIEPQNGANVLRSNGNLHMWNPNQPSPQTEWEKEIDTLLDAGARELDRAKRQQYYWRIQQILQDELPMIQTVRARMFVAVRRSVRNYEPSVWGLYHPERIEIAE